MSESMKRVIPPGEEVVAYQRTAPAGKVVVKVATILSFLAALVPIGLLIGSSGEPMAEGTGACLCAPIGLAALFGLWWAAWPVHEHAVTRRQVITGRKSLGSFNYEVIPLNQITAVRVGQNLSLLGRSQLEIVHAGGTARLPVLGGQVG
jgi:hypothetical protein